MFFFHHPDKKPYLPSLNNMTTKSDEKTPRVNLLPPQNDGEEHPPPAYHQPMTEETSLFNDKSTDIKKPSTLEPDVDVRSVSSTTSSNAEFSRHLLPNTPSFRPAQSFHIAARGIGMLRLPVPSSELEIDIFNSDGSVAYTSTRSRRSKGDCILTIPERGDLLSTNYFFGPSKQPIFRSLSDPVDGTKDVKDTGIFEIKSKWTSRSITMAHKDTGRVYEWSYDKTKTAEGKKANVIILRLKETVPAGPILGRDDSGEKNGTGKILAQLIRSETTRTPGTKSCTAGNGGQLVLDRDAHAGMEEPLIMATCLMMLKKEIDRRRALQFMMLSAAASGGGG
jgi:hypothetical protein